MECLGNNDRCPFSKQLLRDAPPVLHSAWERDLIYARHTFTFRIRYKIAEQETCHAIQLSLSLSLNTLFVPT